jgi:RimJ/RimL family protein N-acetyltransferase
MTAQDTIHTLRLKLRPLALSDAPLIQKAAGARAIADTMISIPHPYPDGEAGRYVDKQLSDREAGHSMAFIIEPKTEGAFYGLVEVRNINDEHSLAELSFWLTPDKWGHGYMSEAVRAVTDYVFETLQLNRIYAYHMVRNPASGHILKKIGFKQEGLLRQRVRKWGKFEDVLLWAALRRE